MVDVKARKVVVWSDDSYFSLASPGWGLELQWTRAGACLTEVRHLRYLSTSASPGSLFFSLNKSHLGKQHWPGHFPPPTTTEIGGKSLPPSGLLVDPLSLPKELLGLPRQKVSADKALIRADFTIRMNIDGTSRALKIHW